MTISNLPAFAQKNKSLSAVLLNAVTGLTTDAPTNAELIADAGVDGALLTKLTATPRGSVTASLLYLFASKDNGVTKRLIATAVLPVYTASITAIHPEVNFNFTEDAPKRLAGGDKLYIGMSAAQAAGVVVEGNWTDF